MFEGVQGELAAAAAADLSTAAVPQLGEEIRELHAIELFARAQRLRRVEAYDRNDGPADHGQLSTTGWVRSQLGLPHSEAAAEVGVALLRRVLPQLAATFDAGRTSFRHLRVTVAAMRRLPEPDVWAELDATVTGWAQEHDAKAYTEMLDALVEQLRPEPKPTDEPQQARRRFSITAGWSGMLNVAGLLPPELGEKLQAALSAASRPDAADETPHHRPTRLRRPRHTSSTPSSTPHCSPSTAAKSHTSPSPSTSTNSPNNPTHTTPLTAGRPAAAMG